MVMSPTNSRPEYKARLQTRYFNATGQCIELYFMSLAPSSIGKGLFSTVRVIVVSEELVESEVVASNGLEPSIFWNRLFGILPGGINYVVIEGQRSTLGFSGLSIDDVIIQPCNKFGQYKFVVFMSCFCT